jgi:hypothetical protein
MGLRQPRGLADDLRRPRRRAVALKARPLRQLAAALFVTALLAGLGPAALAANAPRAASTAPAIFRVGAAVEDIDPSYPVYLGGYGAGPAGGTIERHVDPETGRPEELTVRAISIQAGARVVELASVDSQGWFAAYQEGPYGISDVRAEVAAWLRSHGVPSATPDDIVVSSLHEHAVPSVYGIYSPPAHNRRYLEVLAVQTARALEEAYAVAEPATLSYGTVDAPWLGGGDVAEANELEGWQRDGTLLALWARNARTGATIATYVNEPAYPNIVYGPADLVGGAGRITLISGDFPGYAEQQIQQRVGGVAILASSSLANQASPLQADIAPSYDLPRVDGLLQTRAFDDIMQMGSVVANLTFAALAASRPISQAVVAGAGTEVLTPVVNPALVALQYGDDVEQGALWDSTVGALTGIYPDDRSTLPPYVYGGDLLGTFVTELRIGGLALVSEPGEFYGSLHAALSSGISAPDGVYAIGAAQDFLGYEYPADVTPFTLEGGDELIYGPSPILGDQVVTAGEELARQVGFVGRVTSTAELSVLDEDFGRIADTGVWMLPGAVSGDLSSSRGPLGVRLEAAATPPRPTMVCDNPALLFTPGDCSVPDPAITEFRWHFGDGTSLVTSTAGKARATLSPFVDHLFDRPGIYVVSVGATSFGSSDMASIPVTVYPALSVSIVRRGAEVFAKVRGGDGHYLVERWSLPGGLLSYGPVARVELPGTVSLSVVDGTGSESTASTTFVG